MKCRLCLLRLTWVTLALTAVSSGSFFYRIHPRTRHAYIELEIEHRIKTKKGFHTGRVASEFLTRGRQI